MAISTADRAASRPLPRTEETGTSRFGPARSLLPSIELKRSIPFKLLLAFLVILLITMALGWFAIDRLGAVNRASGEIRDRWLQTTRLLGDLNNYISDLRTAEGNHLLAQLPTEMAAAEAEIAQLRETVDSSERAYERIEHDRLELTLYAAFRRNWQDYLQTMNDVLALSRTSAKAEAIDRYRTLSLKAYAAASETLARLTDLNLAGAREASSRAEDVFDTSQRLIIGLIIAEFLAVIAAVAFVFMTTSRPLLKLARQMGRLARNDTAVEITGSARRDEIGEMARSVLVFRDNAVELIRSQQDLARQADVLAEALDTERTVTQQQRNFVAMASHEFRTPLTNIDGQAQRIAKLRENIEPADLAQRCSQIRRSVVRMTAVIDSLLNAASLSDGQMSITLERVDLKAMIDEICDIQKTISPQHIIHRDLGNLPRYIQADRKLLYQVMTNLLSNAVKYSPAGREIRLAGWIEDESVAISVTDRGIGIPAREVGQLFQRYFRAQNATGIAGTGIGLHLVKTAVEQHGGTVSVSSFEGVGSTFTITLPNRDA